MSDAWVKEPMPTGNGEVVLFRVLSDIIARANVGAKEYGTLLKTNNGRDALMDFYQEYLDGLMYLAQAIMERDNK